MGNVLTIGILQADSVLEQFQPAHGDYPVMFERIIGSVPEQLEFKHYNVELGVYPKNLDECDGYVITGSRLSVYDDQLWIRTLGEFVQTLHAAKKKLVGICFGHQLVAQVLGGKTEPASVGWGVGCHLNRVLKTTPEMPDGLVEFGLLASHKDQVSVLPKGALLLAGNEHCPFSSFQIENHILTFQGHPEFTAEYARSLMTFRKEILGSQTFEKGMLSLQNPIDSEMIAAWIVRFIAATT